MKRKTLIQCAHAQCRRATMMDRPWPYLRRWPLQHFWLQHRQPHQAKFLFISSIILLLYLHLLLILLLLFLFLLILYLLVVVRLQFQLCSSHQVSVDTSTRLVTGNAPSARTSTLPDAMNVSAVLTQRTLSKSQSTCALSLSLSLSSLWPCTCHGKKIVWWGVVFL
jgi:hypothetical protein